MKPIETVQRKPKLTVQQLNYCLLHMLRDKDLFEYAKQHLKPTDFSTISEMKYALIWSAALAAAARNDGKLPEKGLELIIAMELTSKIDNPSEEVTLSSGDNAVDLLIWIFGVKHDDLNPEYYRSLIQDLIIERTIVSQMSKDMTIARDIGRPIDIIKNLDNYNQKLQSVLVDLTQLGQEAFPVDYKPKKLGKFSTGQPWLDSFMNGGQAPGEVYTLGGPTGLGKTTTAIMICISTGRVWNSALNDGIISKPKVSCFFSWEQDLERLRHRFWSYAARIDSSRLELYADEAIELSQQGKLEPYELVEFENEIKTLGLEQTRGEQERLAIATSELGSTIRIFDFSGAADNPHLGEGGLDEVAAVLRSLQKQNFDIGVVMLDYASAAVRRMLSAKGIDQAKVRYYLSNFCNDCRFKIAIPFNCPVWALYQLNTEANRRSPTATQDHTSASECGNFSENAWFAFTFGTKDKVNNTCRLFCTKERRAKGDKPPLLLKVEGNFCRMADASHTHVIDEITHSIPPTSMANRRADPAALRKKMDQEHPGRSNISAY